MRLTREVPVTTPSDHALEYVAIHVGVAALTIFGCFILNGWIL